MAAFRVAHVALVEIVMTDLTEIWDAQQLADYQKRQKANRRGKKSKEMHDKFASDCRARGLPTPHRELMFGLEMLERRWKCDFAWPDFMVMVEIEGLVYRTCYEEPRPGATKVLTVYGRHASPQGIKDDMEKYNSAALLGWFVLRFERDMIMKKNCSVAVDTTVRVLHSRGWRP